MDYQGQKDAMIQLAKGIAQHFGSGCEVAIHDLTTADQGQSIIHIENGHVTGRKIGDAPSKVVREYLESPAANPEDHIGYLTKTPGGKLLKSSTFYMRDDAGKVRFIFSLNYDVSVLAAAEQTLKSIVSPMEEQEQPERISNSVAQLLDELIAESVQLIGKPVHLMDKEDKVRAINYLNDAGALLITKSGDKIAGHFGISKFTLYSYLDKEGVNHD